MKYNELFGNAVFVTPNESCSKRMEYGPYKAFGGIMVPDDDNCSVPYIRGEFKLSKKVKKAELTACGLGLVMLYLNGKEVSGHWCIPDGNEGTEDGSVITPSLYKPLLTEG